jgi:hypothetical protein
MDPKLKMADHQAQRAALFFRHERKVLGRNAGWIGVKQSHFRRYIILHNRMAECRAGGLLNVHEKKTRAVSLGNGLAQLQGRSLSQLLAVLAGYRYVSYFVQARLIQENAESMQPGRSVCRRYIGAVMAGQRSGKGHSVHRNSHDGWDTRLRQIHGPTDQLAVANTIDVSVKSRHHSPIGSLDYPPGSRIGVIPAQSSVFSTN